MTTAGIIASQTASASVIAATSAEKRREDCEQILSLDALADNQFYKECYNYINNVNDEPFLLIILTVFLIVAAIVGLLIWHD